MKRNDVVIGVAMGVFVGAMITMSLNRNHNYTTVIPVRETVQAVSAVGMKTIAMFRMPDGKTRTYGFAEKLSKSVLEEKGAEVLLIHYPDN